MTMGALASKLRVRLFAAAVASCGAQVAPPRCDVHTSCDVDHIVLSNCTGGRCVPSFGVGGTCGDEPNGCAMHAASCTALCSPGYATSTDSTTQFTCQDKATATTKTYVPLLRSDKRRRRRRTPPPPLPPPPPPPQEWSAGTLTCTLEACSAAEMRLPKHATWGSGNTSVCASPPDDGFLPVGTACTAACNSGYYASSGQATRTCLNKGTKGNIGWDAGP